MESTASQLPGGRLVGKVDDAVWPSWYKQVKETHNSSLIDMKTVVSNFLDKEIYKQIETNKSNKEFSNSGENKSEEERDSKDQEGREVKTISWSSNVKTKRGEYMLIRPPKKPGGEEVDGTNPAKAITCYTSSDHENSDKIRIIDKYVRENESTKYGANGKGN